MSIQITDISELGEAFIMRGIEANETPSKRGEFERAASTWAKVMGKEDLESFGCLLCT